LIVLASTDGQYYQNILRDSHTGVLFTGDVGATAHSTRDIFANNTIDNMSGAAVYYSGPREDLRFQNNVVTETPIIHASDSDTDPGDIAIEHNLYDGFRNFGQFSSGRHTFTSWQSAFNHDKLRPTSTLKNPLYVAASADDFRLCLGTGVPTRGCSRVSPAAEIGVDILDLDHDGSTVDQIPAGAYVTGDETIGPMTD
jgi:hypothetical protein